MTMCFVQGEHGKFWIKQLEKHQDSRRDMRALKTYNAIEENATRNIDECHCLQQSLHHKVERTKVLS